VWCEAFIEEVPVSDRATRLAAVYSVIAAPAALLLSPLLALSYFGTAEGAVELETGTVAGWADPARDLVGGLVTWAAPERVYASYVQLFALLFPAIFLCARAARARRPDGVDRFERWAWRTALVGYGLLSAGLLAAGLVLVDASAAVEGSSAYGVLDVVFMSLMFPGMAISAIGSTLLGIALLRSRFQPKITAALLVLAFPALFALSTLLGHNGLALLPLFLAWAATGRRLLSEQSAGTAVQSGARAVRARRAL
jgi:hypothetical protein